MLVIVDIDGTVADMRARFAKAPKPVKGDKVAFQQWLDKVQSHKDVLEDKPVRFMQELLQGLDKDYHIVYLTGRSESYRLVTKAWLGLHEFPSAQLYMRQDNDWRKPAEYKEEQMHLILTQYCTRNFLAFDDDYDGDCAEMYRRLGGTHLKVTTCLEK